MAKFIVSKVPGLTIGTSSPGDAAFLSNPGDRVSADLVSEGYLKQIEAGVYDDVLELVEDEGSVVSGDQARQHPISAPGGGIEQPREVTVVEGEGTGAFDPTGHSVNEVLDHLKGADDAERARVKQAEASSDRNSKMIANA